MTAMQEALDASEPSDFHLSLDLYQNIHEARLHSKLACIAVVASDDVPQIAEALQQ
jgi:hypothetical protein